MKSTDFIPCPRCTKEISAQARSCPHCGHPINLYRGFEWRSRWEINNWPLVHVTFGRNKTTGKLMVSKGIIAIGQFGIGVITIAQFGIGLLFGFGQFILGATALAQFAGGFYFAIGQFAVGKIAIGQLAFGQYVLAQVGWGNFVWSVGRKDPIAWDYFQMLWVSVKDFLGLI